ncbi:MAG: polyprenol monophosphomannose synthase [Terriglobales bacterium]
MDSAPRLSLVLPTYNEAANLEHLVRALIEVLDGARVSFEIVIVDDNSPDGTGGIADQLAAGSGGRVRALHRKEERGLGTAVVAGWKAARGEILAVMDADGQHPPDLIPRLLAALDPGAEVAVASRYISGSDIPRWNLLRRLGSRLATAITRLALPRAAAGVRDPLSGCFALRRELIQGVEPKPLGFKILLEVLMRAPVTRVTEVEYVFAAREAGKSKLSARVALLDAMQILRSSWQVRGKAGGSRQEAGRRG